MRTIKLVSIVLAGLLAGCVTNPTTGKQELSATGKVALQEVAGIAVRRITTANPRAEEIAVRIRAAAVELQGITESVTVAELKSRLEKRINERVDNEVDRQDLLSLLNISAALLTDYVGKGEIAPDQFVKVNEFVGYLVAALPR